MDPADRIAAYLADELDDEQRRAFEADLGRDAALRADLEAVRRADDALRAQPPTALPPGAGERLWGRLTPELEARYRDDGAAPAAGASAVSSPVSAGDELTPRRARRAGRDAPWTAIGGIAAAVVAVAVVSVGVVGGGGANDEAAETFAADGADDQAMLESAPGIGEEGPVLRATGRALTGDDAPDLLDDPAVRELVAAGLSGPDADVRAAANAAAFGSSTGAAPFGSSGTDDDMSADTADELDDAGPAATPDAAPEEEARRRSTVPAAPLRTEGEVDPQVRDQVGACLEVLLAGGGDPIVALAEVIEFDGEPAVAFVLAGRGADGSASRAEVWVLDLAGCEVRLFRPDDA